MICTKFENNNHNGVQSAPRTKNGAALIKRVAAVALAIVLMLAFGGCSETKGTKGSTGPSPQQAADRFANAINKGDTEMMLGAMMPDKAIKALEEESGMSASSLATMFAGAFDEISDVKIEVKEKQDIDEDEIDEMKESMKEYGINVSNVELREVELSCKQDGKTETETEEAYFYQADGEWYIIPN